MDQDPVPKSWQSWAGCEDWTPLYQDWILFIGIRSINPACVGWVSILHAQSQCFRRGSFHVYRADHMTQIWPIRVPHSFTPTQWFLDMHMTQTVPVKGSPRTAAKLVKEEEPYLETMSTEKLWIVEQMIFWWSSLLSRKPNQEKENGQV